MFEDMTYEKILENALDRVPDDLDKREGSIIFNAIAPACAELAQAYIAMKSVYDATYADTATGEYLERRTKERGILRESATYAVVEGEFTPSDIDVIGKRFTCGNLTYTVTGENELTCETAGVEANAIAGKLIPVEYIEGLESASIIRVLQPAEDQESDDSLRNRYFESLRGTAFGGNIADYKQKTNAIDGVGGVKVDPVWNGGGTVKLVIIDSEYNVPTDYLVEQVQTIIDPTGDAKGLGTAPIGHIVTVVPVDGITINIDTTIEYDDGWDYESAKPYMIEAINEYFKELCTAWKDQETLTVRISHIETRLLLLPCIADISNTMLNNVESNITLDKFEIPIRGTLNGS